MKQMLVYGDSLSWGLIPGTRNRLTFEQRWPGVLENRLCHAGHTVRVNENCLNGRRTVWSDPFKEGRKGCRGLAQVIEMHSPLDLVVLIVAAAGILPRSRERAFSTTSGLAMRTSYFLRQLSMLDVCIVGVLLSSLAASVYEEQGVAFPLMPGIYTLALAEVIHYSLYYALSCIIGKRFTEAHFTVVVRSSRPFHPGSTKPFGTLPANAMAYPFTNYWEAPHATKFLYTELRIPLRESAP